MVPLLTSNKHSCGRCEPLSYSGRHSLACDCQIPTVTNKLDVYNLFCNMLLYLNEVRCIGCLLHGSSRTRARGALQRRPGRPLRTGRRRRGSRDARGTAEPRSGLQGPASLLVDTAITLRYQVIAEDYAFEIIKLHFRL